MKGKLLMAIGIVWCLLPAIGAEALDFQPGQYQITSTAEIPGMPAVPAQQTVQCLTEQEPVSADMVGSGCSISNLKTSGNTVSWSMTCDQQGTKATGTGRITYQHDSFSGVFTTTMDTPGGPVTITTKSTGTRIGPCP